MSNQPQESGSPISNSIQYIVIRKGDQGAWRLIAEHKPFDAVYHKVYGLASEEQCRE